jgi:CBS domain-containing protein
MRVRDILTSKAEKNVLTITPGSSVRELLVVLSEHNIGALVVSEDGRAVVGIVSERDVVRQLSEHPDILAATVESIMTADVHTVPPQHRLDDLMSEMTERRVRHVPVVDDGVLVGIVSIGDVVKHKIDDLQFERDQLDHYVHQT